MLGSHLKQTKLWQYVAIALISLLSALGLGDLPLLKPAFLQTERAIAQAIQPSEESIVSVNPDILVQQGVTLYHEGDFQAAIAQWNLALAQYEQAEENTKAAIVLENLARTYQLIGQVEQSIERWTQAIDLYRRMEDVQQVARLLSEQAQSYSRIGQYRKALTLLCGVAEPTECTPGSAIAISTQTGDPSIQIVAWGSLGEAYRLMGNIEAAELSLRKGLEIAQNSGETLYLASLHNSLGNTYINRAQDQYRRALSAQQAEDQQVADQLRQAGIEYDQQAINQFQLGLQTDEPQVSAATQLRLLINLIRPAYRVGAADIATAAYTEAIAHLRQLPNSQEKVYAALDLATLSTPIPPVLSSDDGLLFSGDRCSSMLNSDANDLLQTAISVAQSIGDYRSESFALGALGHEYECRQEYVQALQWTQLARWAAEQDLRSRDSLYLWEWQSGRLLKAQGKEEEAIALYEQSIQTLESIRGDLLVANQDTQFNFRDNVEPLYRELIALRLEQEPAPIDSKAAIASKENIDATLRQFDSLKLAELQNYFGDDCVITPLNEGSVDITPSEQTTAVLSSIVLDGKTAILLSLPSGQQSISWINADSATVRATINEYRRSLERFYNPFDSQQSKTVYNWIIAPFVDILQTAQIKTLVFVQDDIFRSVPMAALYDDVHQQFLIERYAIATTPSLALIGYRPLEKKDLRALALGLTEKVTIDGQVFQALENVEQETLTVEELLPGSQRLLNQDFTYARLQQELDENIYPVIHIATHGEFGTEPEDTFLVTGDGQKLTITQLDSLLRSTQSAQQLELLSLTACQTAVGDNRSALGLAGVAVQSGAKSAIASLWFISDQATAELMDRFYSNWVEDSTLSKAEALQAAQISIIRSGGEMNHPAYWAPFLLVGDWL